MNATQPVFVQLPKNPKKIFIRYLGDPLEFRHKEYEN